MHGTPVHKVVVDWANNAINFMISLYRSQFALPLCLTLSFSPQQSH